MTSENVFVRDRKSKKQRNPQCDIDWTLPQQDWYVDERELWDHIRQHGVMFTCQPQECYMVFYVIWNALDQKRQAWKNHSSIVRHLYVQIYRHWPEEAAQQALIFYYTHFSEDPDQRKAQLADLKAVFGKTLYYQKLDQMGLIQRDPQVLYKAMRSLWRGMIFTRRCQAFCHELQTRLARNSFLYAQLWLAGIKEFIQVLQNKIERIWCQTILKSDLIQLHDNLKVLIQAGYNETHVAKWPFLTKQWVRRLVYAYERLPGPSRNRLVKRLLLSILQRCVTPVYFSSMPDVREILSSWQTSTKDASLQFITFVQKIMLFCKPLVSDRRYMQMWSEWSGRKNFWRSMTETKCWQLQKIYIPKEIYELHVKRIEDFNFFFELHHNVKIYTGARCCQITLCAKYKKNYLVVDIGCGQPVCFYEGRALQLQRVRSFDVFRALQEKAIVQDRSPDGDMNVDTCLINMRMQRWFEND